MGDVPTHNCTVAFEGESQPTVLPGSVLDCGQRRCRSRAEQAELAADMYALEYIEQRLGEYEDASRLARENISRWELYREAKQRRVT
ncbi:hypothetical protein ACNQR7_30830 [Mycolicibacterium senegalense]|uniref:hypothetical protein n=1 Tax=Mycolicibacterium senegalense TaxID=1796 RepID=UPI003AAED313